MEVVIKDSNGKVIFESNQVDSCEINNLYDIRAIVRILKEAGVENPLFKN